MQKSSYLQKCHQHCSQSSTVYNEMSQFLHTSMHCVKTSKQIWKEWRIQNKYEDAMVNVVTDTLRLSVCLGWLIYSPNHKFFHPFIHIGPEGHKWVSQLLQEHQKPNHSKAYWILPEAKTQCINHSVTCYPWSRTQNKIQVTRYETSIQIGPGKTIRAVMLTKRESL